MLKDLLSKNLSGEFNIFNNKQESFQYDCIQCGKCCQKLTVTIDPYDVLRLKSALQKSTTEIMQQNLNIMQDETTGWPIAFLRYAQTGKCEFNKANKCLVWRDRPKVCRLFPLGMASTVQIGNPAENTYYLLKRSTICQGFSQQKNQSVQDWLDESQLDAYLNEYEKFTAIKYALISQFDFNTIDASRIMLIAMALYDIDALFAFLPKVYKLADDIKLKIALIYLQWLVNEIVPDKTGTYNSLILSPAMQKKDFFAVIANKLQEIIDNILS